MGDKTFRFVIMVICGAICGFVVLANLFVLYLRQTGESVDGSTHFGGAHVGFLSGAATLALWRSFRGRG